MKSAPTVHELPSPVPIEPVPIDMVKAFNKKPYRRGAKAAAVLLAFEMFLTACSGSGSVGRPVNKKLELDTIPSFHATNVIIKADTNLRLDPLRVEENTRIFLKKSAHSGKELPSNACGPTGDARLKTKISIGSATLHIQEEAKNGPWVSINIEKLPDTFEDTCPEDDADQTLWAQYGQIIFDTSDPSATSIINTAFNQSSANSIPGN